MKFNANELIRVFLTKRGSNISKLAQLLTEKTGKKVSQQNLSGRMLKGTIRYDEMLIIAELLGFEIKFEDLKNPSK